MMNKMIKSTTALMLVGLLSLNLGCTSSAMANPDEQTQPQQPDTHAAASVTLTEDQINIVKEILSNYDSDNITVEDALAMNEEFRDAGIRGGHALNDAIESMGFDTKEIRELAPPKENRENDGPNNGDDKDPNDRPPRNEDENNISEPNKGDDKDPNERPPRNEDENNENNPNNTDDKDPNDRPPRNEDENDKARPEGQAQGYSIKQAVSDNAQLKTIAFDALAYFTGELGADSFLPPGKVSDYFGFQYFRDVDEGELGHNTQFLTRIANNVFYVLDEDQIAEMKTLAEEQTKLISQYGYERFPLMKAFRQLQEGDLPEGTTGLDLDAVKAYSAELYEIDGELSYHRAEVLGGIIRSLTDDQRAYLDDMASGSSLTWPILDDQLDKRGMGHDEHVAMMTYASEMFSWYAGDIESDTYFCPERQGTYFGSFYMKDMPAMGNPDYSISTSITGDSGEAFLNALTEEQRQLIEDLVDLQRDELLEIVETRRVIAAELREFMNSNDVDEEKVMELSRTYGELDGEIVYYYATHFAEVFESLTDEQMELFMELRNLDGYTVNGAFLYSEPIAMPEIGDIDFLFE